MPQRTAARPNLWIALIITGVLATLACPAQAAMDARELLLLSDNLGKTFRRVQIINHISSEMELEAKPFLRAHYARCYRFQPSQNNARNVLSETRQIAERMRLVMGILYQAPIPELDKMFKRFFSSNDAMVTFAKRSLRAIKDNNHALYMASAQAMAKEARVMADVLSAFETAINDATEKANDKRENL